MGSLARGAPGEPSPYQPVLPGLFRHPRKFVYGTLRSNHVGIPRAKAGYDNCAAWRGRTGAIKTLLAAGADPDARNVYRATPLDIAVRERQREAAETLGMRNATKVVDQG